MPDLLIRGLPATTHEELKRRAGRAGMSVQAYVSQLLDRHAGTLSVAEWLTGLDDLRPHPEISGADVVRAARDDLP
jgi:hypothetical protein